MMEQRPSDPSEDQGLEGEGSPRRMSSRSGGSQHLHRVFSMAVGESRTTLVQEESRAMWDTRRVMIHKMLHSNLFETVMGCLICSNVLILLLEADVRARCYPEECRAPELERLNLCLLAIYTLEAGVRMYVDRSRYFHNGWNGLDFSIVCLGFFDEMNTRFDLIGKADLLSLFRIFRVARLFRALRLLRFYPDLYVMVKGFIGALRSMFWGFCMICLLLIFWSLLTVELLHPLNYDMIEQLRRERPEDVNEFCLAAFSSIFEAIVIYFQTLVAGDSWGQCMIPIVHHHPWTILFFAAALITVTLGFMNLILAVIVDNATKAREGDQEEQLAKKKEIEGEALKTWGNLLSSLGNEDAEGTITLEELHEAYDKVSELHDCLNMMGIGRDDLKEIFQLIDKNQSGDLDHDEFMGALVQAQSQDQRTYLMMTRLGVEHICENVRQLSDDVAKLTANVSHGTAAADLAGSPRPQVGAAEGRPRWLDDAFQDMHARLQEHFAALARCVELDAVALVRQAREPEDNGASGRAAADLGAWEAPKGEGLWLPAGAASGGPGEDAAGGATGLSAQKQAPSVGIMYSM